MHYIKTQISLSQGTNIWVLVYELYVNNYYASKKIRQSLHNYYNKCTFNGKNHKLMGYSQVEGIPARA